VTSANFGELAAQYSMDPGSKDRGGSLGVFKPGDMVPEFEAGVKALAPGAISPALVESDFGFHIIRRRLFDEVRSDFTAAVSGNNDQRTEQAYYEKLETEAKVAIKPDVVAKVREVAKDPESFLTDKVVLASSRKGNFTTSKLARWILAFPPQAQIRPQLQQGPDESVESFLKAMVRNELLVAKADEEKVTVDDGDLSDIRATFRVMVAQAWQGLGVDPADSANAEKSSAERERLYAARVDDLIDQMLKTGGQGYVDIPQPLADALRGKYSSRIVTAGLDRATERATIVRAALDSTRARGGSGSGMGGGGMGAPQVVPPGTQLQPLPTTPPGGGQ
jgi:hypothetical protein